MEICWAWNTSRKDLSMILEFFHWDWDLPNRTCAFSFILLFFKFLHDHLLNIFMSLSLHDIFISPLKFIIFSCFTAYLKLKIKIEALGPNIPPLVLLTKCTCHIEDPPNKTPPWYMHLSQQKNITHLQKEETKCLIFWNFHFLHIRWGDEMMHENVILDIICISNETLRLSGVIGGALD